MSQNQNSSNNGLFLKLDTYIKRDPDRGARYEVVKPLTEMEKKYLASVCRLKCSRAYYSRLTFSALRNEYEEDADLNAESFIFMWNILDKFDTSKCGKIVGFQYDPHEEEVKKKKKRGTPYRKKKGVLEKSLDDWIKFGAKVKYKRDSEGYEIMYLEYKGKMLKSFDIPGAKRPKTLEFYFLNYFYGRVNFLACEARTAKKSRGIGPADQVGDISYDEEGVEHFTPSKAQYSITEVVFSELKKKDFQFQRFFAQKFYQELKVKELKEEYGDKFNKINQELITFLNHCKKINRKL